MSEKKRQKKLSEQSQHSDHVRLELVAELERFKKLVSGLGNANPLAQQIECASDLRKSAQVLSDKAKALEKSLEKQEKLEKEMSEKPTKKVESLKPVRASTKSSRLKVSKSS